MSGGIIISDNETAKRLNELARHKMIVRLHDDIRIDLTICEIEGWSKLEYIEILTELINSFAKAERRTECDSEKMDHPERYTDEDIIIEEASE